MSTPTYAGVSRPAYAHTAELPDGRRDPDESHWQPLHVHLRNVASLAKKFATPFGLSAEAELAGLLHDLGKYAGRFQGRLRNPAISGINHWAAGAAYLAQTLKHFDAAFAVDGHHTGIPALNGTESLRQTVDKMKDEVRRTEFTRCPESLDVLLTRMMNDGLTLPAVPLRRIDKGSFFAEALRTRLLFSCLVDADFLDTEAHFDRSKSLQRIVPKLEPERALDILSAHLDGLNAQGDLNRRRRKLLTDCLRAAKLPPGLFTLTAPTGSGKTLASLAFALKHIEDHNKRLSVDDPGRLRRVIVVIPFTSIIEQTAAVYRDLFEASFGPDYVLEHHSSVAPLERREDRGKDAEDERLWRARLATENWASPLVVTTSVQFFESLFSNRASDCRKLHNIGQSVVVFDEVQTLPPGLVPSLLSAVKLLTRDYGVTAVFMTATQPAFNAAAAALPYGWEPTPIATDEDGLAEALRRTCIELPAPRSTLSWETLAERLAAETQALCVVNTTKDARALFQLVQNRAQDGLFLLSSRLCPQHRREKLAVMRRRLYHGKPCRLVSTQLIEAGVDVDFPIAFRAFGPLDSIIQTAGRCNREGKSAAGRPVIVFRPEEMKTPPGAYRLATAKTQEFLDRHPDAANQLHRPDFYADYFRELYGLLGPQSVKDDEVFAACEALDFPKAAEACQLIGDETRAVLVKWGRGADLAQKLEREKHLTASECREAQRFSVNLYQREFLDAQARGYVYQPAEDWNFWVWNSDYDDDRGLGHLDIESFQC
ncbi:MAG TPA: CRISPR-associated helicase Cas3' [Chthoniobacterales bacterium]